MDQTTTKPFATTHGGKNVCRENLIVIPHTCGFVIIDVPSQTMLSTIIKETNSLIFYGPLSFGIKENAEQWIKKGNIKDLKDGSIGRGITFTNRSIRVKRK